MRSTQDGQARALWRGALWPGSDFEHARRGKLSALRDATKA